MGALPEKGQETRLPPARPQPYLGHHLCRVCLPPHIPRLRDSTRRSVHRAPGPPAPSPVSRRLPQPHSKFASALAHWLAGWRSREAAAHSPTQAEPRPLGRPHVTHCRQASTSGHSPPESREGGAGCQAGGPAGTFAL